MVVSRFSFDDGNEVLSCPSSHSRSPKFEKIEFRGLLVMVHDTDRAVLQIITASKNRAEEVIVLPLATDHSTIFFVLEISDRKMSDVTN